MADITHLFLRRHLRSGPTAWTRHSVGGGRGARASGCPTPSGRARR